MSFEPSSYVIQVTFLHGKREHNRLGSVHLFEKTGGMFGVGDNSLFFCPQDGCFGIIKQSSPLSEEEADKLASGAFTPDNLPVEIGNKFKDWMDQVHICPACGTVCKTGDLSECFVSRLTMQQWAEQLSMLHSSLNSNADIYASHHVSKEAVDRMRRAQAAPTTRTLAKYAELIDESRQRRTCIYTNASIQKDISGGSDKAKKILAFLNA